MYIENVVVGNPICTPQEMFSLNENDWEQIEKDKTYFTNERFLPKILFDLNIAPSISEVRRNRKDLVVRFEDDKLDYIEIKYGKRKLFLLIGREGVK